MARRDEDALSWGDDDPTLDTGVDRRTDPSTDDATPARGPAPRAAEPDAASGGARASLPDGFTAVGRGSDAAESATTVETTSSEREPLSNAGLLALGVLGGVYVLFSVGWLIGGLRLQAVAGFLVARAGDASPLWTAGNVVALWLAVLAPPIWFATVYRLTARSRPWMRWLLLVIGAILLVPWPFVMVGAVGA